MSSVPASAVTDLLKREPAKLVGATGIFFDALSKRPPQSTIADVLESHRAGVWGTEAAEGYGFPVLRSTNMRGSKADVSYVAWRELPAKQAADCALLTGDILVTKSSGSSDLVGKSVLFIQPDDGRTYLFSNFTHRLRPNQKLIAPPYLAWFLRSPQALGWRYETQQTTVGLRNLQTAKFLSQHVPTPPLSVQQAVADYLDALELGRESEAELPAELAEQRRVVARIEELATQIHEARSLRNEAAEEAEALLSRATSHLLDDSGWATKPLSEILAEPPRNGLSPKQQVETGGRDMLRINAVSSAPTRFVDMTAVKRVEISDEVARPFLVQNDDVFIVRYNGDINRVAKPAIYKGINEFQVVYPDKLMRLRPNHAKMTPDFLVVALNSRSVREQIEVLGKTTAGNIGISGRNAKSFKVPSPPVAEQRRIVAGLDALQAEVDALKRVQAEAAAELDALLPAILDKAFKGEL
jgi:restriction endonuclease S subunit